MNKRLELFKDKLGIKLKEDSYCHADISKNTIFLKEGCSDYDIAHEISHIICGWGCCREHCEWEAHGGAKVLCELFGVDKKEVEDAEERMKCYAFRTNPIVCGRYSKENSWVEEVKKEERERLINFGEFMKTNISGKFLLNTTWLEHLLNLFYQGYLAEVQEEIWNTQHNNCETIENSAYGIIGSNFDKKHLELNNGTLKL